MEPLKPAKTYQEQVSRLIEKGVIVNDTKRCMRFLHKVNYYRFLAYLLTFRNKDGETYKNVPFEKAEGIYYFDREMRSLLLPYIEDIEIRLRTALSYYHGHRYGPGGYEDASSFNAKHDHDSFFKHIESCINENKNSPVVKHHNNKYGGHFPIWVIIEFFSVGELSYFYRGMKYKDRREISQYLYGVGEDIMRSWLRCFTDLRNRCAHYSRLYYWVFPAIPKFPEGTNISDRRLFSQIYMLKLMYHNKQKWNESFLKRLENMISRHQDEILLSCIGFPDNWKEILTK